MSNERINLQVTSGGISYGILAKLREEKIVADDKNLSGSVWAGIMKLVAEDEDARAQYTGGSNFIAGTSDVAKRSWINNFRIKAGQSLSFTKELWSKIVQYVQTGKVTETPKPKVVAESDSEVIASDLEDAKANVQARKHESSSHLSEKGNIRVQMGLNEVTSEKVVPGVETDGIHSEVSDDGTKYTINNNDGTISITKDGKTETRQMTPEEKGLSPQQLVVNLEAAKATSKAEVLLANNEADKIEKRTINDDSINGTYTLTETEKGECNLEYEFNGLSNANPSAQAFQKGLTSSYGLPAIKKDNEGYYNFRGMKSKNYNTLSRMVQAKSNNFAVKTVVYQDLQSRQSSGETLTSAELKFMEGYVKSLKVYGLQFNANGELEDMPATESGKNTKKTRDQKRTEARKTKAEVRQARAQKRAGAKEARVQKRNEEQKQKLGATSELSDTSTVSDNAKQVKEVDIPGVSDVEDTDANPVEVSNNAYVDAATQEYLANDAIYQDYMKQYNELKSKMAEIENKYNMNITGNPNQDMREYFKITDTDVWLKYSEYISQAKRFASNLDSYEEVMTNWKDGSKLGFLNRNGKTFDNVEAITLLDGQRAWKSDEGVFYPYVDGKIGGAKVPEKLRP